MNATAQTDPKDIYTGLLTWDLTPVEHLLVTREGHAPNEVAEMVDEYRKYIAIIISRRRRGETRGMPICEGVDPVWHAHVLHTQDYIAMCRTHAGFYIHHQPMEVDETLISEYHEVTIPEYRSAFGPPPSHFWGAGKYVCRGSDGEGNCTNQCTGKGDAAPLDSPRNLAFWGVEVR